MNNFNFAVLEGFVREHNYYADKQLFECGVEVKRSSKDENNVTTFLVKMEGRLAETCAKHLSTGSRVLVSGTLQNDGHVHLAAKEVNFLAKKS